MDADTRDISISVLGYWWWWLFVVPSLRSRRPKGQEKAALDIAFLGTPLISLIAPIATKDTFLIWAGTSCFFCVRCSSDTVLIVAKWFTNFFALPNLRLGTRGNSGLIYSKFCCCCRKLRIRLPHWQRRWWRWRIVRKPAFLAKVHLQIIRLRKRSWAWSTKLRLFLFVIGKLHFHRKQSTLLYLACIFRWIFVMPQLCTENEDLTIEPLVP